MPSQLEFVQFAAEQLQDAGHITYRKMFGDYGIYCDGKIFGLICDNQLFVKITDPGRQFAPDLETAPPYGGAKPHFLIADVDNKAFLTEFVRITCAALPAPKPKKKKPTNKITGNQ